MISMAQFTTAEVAEKFGTTPKTLRKFLRADARANEAGDTLPGKGSRYAIDGKALKGLQGRFTKWQAAEAEARAARAAKAAEDAAEAAAEVDAEGDAA
jgi:predicted transcriptional regulator